MIASKSLLAAAPSRALAFRSVAPLPLRRFRCSAAQQEKQQAQPSTAAAAAPSPAPLALALLNLAAAGPSLAADAVISIGDSEQPVFALSPAELALVTIPVIGYAIYNYARSKNPKLNLGFQDLLLIIAAVFLFGNIFSIVVFKTSFY